MRCPACNTPIVGNSLTCESCGRPLRLGQRLEQARRGPRAVLANRFRLDEIIATSSTSEVFDALEIATDTRVIVRLFHRHLEMDERFAERVTALQGTHVVRILDSGFADTHYAVTERMAGRSLADAGRLAWPHAYELLVQICTALAGVHAVGLVHRRLTPAKVYLERAPSQVVSGDPYRGSVEAIEHTKLDISTSGLREPGADVNMVRFRVTPRLDYQSPEQLMGKPLDALTDIYSLGVLGYELVTGHRPFPDAKGPAGLIIAQLKQTPNPPSSVVDTIPPAADAVLLRCLAKHKRDRFADIIALRDALRAAIDAG